ncbi:MAG: tRNA pseudouridine(38-40) synthase TruA [Thermotogae bacterium]|nr:tRNA pseudouridine(38-40) synthase TruA [Thermotogota bacterium]HOO74426.1 tRNA pseudouridine(38-40) synthase TruA [Tepiditoga sp.]
MRVAAATVSYIGTDFFGYQAQPDVRTVQGEFEKALEKIFKQKLSCWGSGRTDTGVHAFGQVIAFMIPNENINVKNLKDGLNSVLPRDIYIRELKEVSEKFNPRFDAKKRVYHYYIHRSEEPNIFIKDRVWWFPYDLDIQLMRNASRYLEGEHDFTSFKSGNDKKNPMRTVNRIRILEMNNNILLIRVEGQSFLRRMVRNIVGTLVKVGTKTWEPETVKELLESKDRSVVPASAPPHGLYFYSVYF